MAFKKRCEKCGSIFETAWAEGEPLCDNCKSKIVNTKKMNHSIRSQSIARSNNNFDELPREYYIDYYSKNGIIDTSLIGEKVNKIALMFEKKVTYVQLRKFYDECQGYKNLPFADIDINLKLLKAKLAYAKGRKVIGNSFYQFMNNRIDNIKDEKDFKYFLMHFQALLSYFKLHNPK